MLFSVCSNSTHFVLASSSVSGEGEVSVGVSAGRQPLIG